MNLPQPASAIEWDGDRVVWRIAGAPPQTAHFLLQGEPVEFLLQADTGSGLLVEIVTAQPFDLDIVTEFVVFSERIPVGSTHYRLTYLDRTDIRDV